jgi:hypothetical protein
VILGVNAKSAPKFKTTSKLKFRAGQLPSFIPTPDSHRKHGCQPLPQCPVQLSPPRSRATVVTMPKRKTYTGSVRKTLTALLAISDEDSLSNPDDLAANGDSDDVPSKADLNGAKHTDRLTVDESDNDAGDDDDDDAEVEGDE